MIVAFWWAVCGRTATEPGDVVLPYEERSTVVLWTVGLLGLLEVGVVHVLTASWPVVRWGLFVVGVLGLVGFLGWGLSLRQRPHVVRRGALVLRSGSTHEVQVPLPTLASVRRRVVGEHRRILDVDDGRLALSFMGDTNVELRFDPPVPVAGQDDPVARVAFWVDDPTAALRLLRERTAAG